MRINKNILLAVGFAALTASVSFNYNYGTKSIRALENSNIQLSAPTMDTDSAIKEFILDHPEVLIESLEKFRVSSMQKQVQEIENQVVKNYDLFYGDDSFVMGNPDAEIKIVEFFDYRCGYCKKVAETFRQLVKENPNVKVYMKDIPIMGGESVEAAKAAVAAGLLGKYKEYSHALLNTDKPLNEETFREIAKEVGLNANELIEMMSSENVAEILMKNRMLASMINLQGTPTIFIETQMYQGDLSLGDFSTIIREKMKDKMKEVQ